MVGDTGFEPVISTVCKRHIKPKSYYLKNFPVFIDP